MTEPRTIPPSRSPLYANVGAVAAVGLAVAAVASPPTQLLIVLPVLFVSIAGRWIAARRFRTRARLSHPAGRETYTRRRITLAVLATSTPLFLVGLLRPGFLAVWYAGVTVAVVEISLRSAAQRSRRGPVAGG